jgi:hypothetical protein
VGNGGGRVWSLDDVLTLRRTPAHAKRRSARGQPGRPEGLDPRRRMIVRRSFRPPQHPLHWKRSQAQVRHRHALPHTTTDTNLGQVGEGAIETRFNRGAPEGRPGWFSDSRQTFTQGALLGRARPLVQPSTGSPISSHSRHTQSLSCRTRALRIDGTIVTPHAGQIGGFSSVIRNRDPFSLQRPRFDLAHAVRSTHQRADHGDARPRGGRPEQARVAQLHDQCAESSDESEMHLVLIPANVGYDSGRPRAASEEPSVVTRLVLKARCRPSGRRPGNLHGTAVRLEPCESGRESSDRGRDGCPNTQNEQ